MRKRVLATCGVLVVLVAGAGSLVRIVGHAWVALAGISSVIPHAADGDGFGRGKQAADRHARNAAPAPSRSVDRPPYDSGYEQAFRGLTERELTLPLVH